VLSKVVLVGRVNKRRNKVYSRVHENVTDSEHVSSIDQFDKHHSVISLHFKKLYLFSPVEHDNAFITYIKYIIKFLLCSKGENRNIS
jgi:hypothetical protein